MTVATGLWDLVVGQDATVTVLRTAVGRDEVAHAWMFAGPRGVGQREAAAALAADLNCPQADGAACGACSTCERLRTGAHPSLLTFEPEGAEHVVSAVREQWLPAASRSLTEGRLRLLYVAAADRMNEAAQNAFLKVLEEPPGPVIWVLEVEDAANLLETVVSRARRLDFATWRPDHLAEVARGLGVGEDDVPVVVRASLGSPERLRDLADPDVFTARSRHLAIVGELADRGPGAAVPIAREIDGWAKDRVKARKTVHDEELAALEEAFAGEWPPGMRNRVQKRLERLQREERRRALNIALDDLASYLRDLVVTARGGQAVNVDHTTTLARDRGAVPAHVAFDALDAVRDCLDAIERQGQPELHLERLLLRIGVAIYNERTSA